MTNLNRNQLKLDRILDRIQNMVIVTVMAGVVLAACGQRPMPMADITRQPAVVEVTR